MKSLRPFFRRALSWAAGPSLPGEQGDLPVPADAAGEDSFELRTARWVAREKLAWRVYRTCLWSLVPAGIIWVSPALYTFTTALLIPFALDLWRLAHPWGRWFYALTLVPATVGLLATAAHRVWRRIHNSRPKPGGLR